MGASLSQHLRGSAERPALAAHLDVTPKPPSRQLPSEIEGAEPVGHVSRPSDVLALQRLIGNQGVLHALAPTGDELGAVQRKPGLTKTTVTKPGALKALATKPKGGGVTKPGKPPPTKGAVAMAKVTTTLSKRARRPAQLLEQQLHWTIPAYGGSSDFVGGTSVSVELGTASGQPTSYGSKPLLNACTAVNALNLANYGNYYWIKGHLLNDNLGGLGVSRNLTPLTTGANTVWQGAFESKIKNALTVCYRQSDRDGYFYGVHCEVAASGSAFPGALPGTPESTVKAQIDGQCWYIRRAWVGGVNLGPIEVVAQPAWALPLPAGTVSRPCVS